jgi:hypothetical protein
MGTFSVRPVIEVDFPGHQRGLGSATFPSAGRVEPRQHTSAPLQARVAGHTTPSGSIDAAGRDDPHAAGIPLRLELPSQSILSQQFAGRLPQTLETNASPPSVPGSDEASPLYSLFRGDVEEVHSPQPYRKPARVERSILLRGTSLLVVVTVLVLAIASLDSPEDSISTMPTGTLQPAAEPAAASDAGTGQDEEPKAALVTQDWVEGDLTSNHADSVRPDGSTAPEAQSVLSTIEIDGSVSSAHRTEQSAEALLSTEDSNVERPSTADLQRLPKGIPTVLTSPLEQEPEFAEAGGEAVRPHLGELDAPPGSAQPTTVGALPERPDRAHPPRHPEETSSTADRLHNHAAPEEPPSHANPRGLDAALTTPRTTGVTMATDMEEQSQQKDPIMPSGRAEPNQEPNPGNVSPASERTELAPAPQTKDPQATPPPLEATGAQTEPSPTEAPPLLKPPCRAELQALNLCGKVPRQQ